MLKQNWDYSFFLYNPWFSISLYLSYNISIYLSTYHLPIHLYTYIVYLFIHLYIIYLYISLSFTYSSISLYSRSIYLLFTATSASWRSFRSPSPTLWRHWTRGTRLWPNTDIGTRFFLTNGYWIYLLNIKYSKSKYKSFLFLKEIQKSPLFLYKS